MTFPNYSFSDTNNGQLNPALLHEEIVALGLSSAALEGINADSVTAQFVVVTDAEPTAADRNAIDTAVASHDGIFFRSWDTIVHEQEMEPVVPGASKVIANDRPAIEVQNGVTGYGAIQALWALVQDVNAQIRVRAKFVLKDSGTGSNVRIAARVKSHGAGEDSTSAFTVASFVVVPVSFTTIGEVFDGEVILDASSIELDDAVALQVGRDGNNELGAGSNDDVDQAVQLIALKVEAR